MKKSIVCFGLFVVGICTTPALAACNLTSPLSPSTLLLNYSFLNSTNQNIGVALTCDAPGEETGFDLNISVANPSTVSSGVLTGRLSNGPKYLNYQIENLPTNPLSSQSYTLPVVIPSNQFPPAGVYQDTITIELTAHIP